MKKNKQSKKFKIPIRKGIVICLSVAIVFLLILDINVIVRAQLRNHKKLPISSHNTPSQPKQPSTVQSPTKTIATPTPSPTKNTKPTTPSTHASLPAPEPVIVPAPTSTVTNLVPTPSPAPAIAPPTINNTTPLPAISYSSTNWSGYLEASGNYSQVSGSWIVPSATGNNISTSSDGTWIGIGGVTSGDLIQIGTMNTITASGNITTSAFVEELPNYAQIITTLTVSQGDSVTASIVETTLNNWTMNIRDNTTGESYTTNVAYTSTHSSAEWIQEDPSYSRNRLIPLDNFLTVSFTNCNATKSSQSYNLLSLNPSIVYLVDASRNILATPSSIFSDGSSFTVTQKQ